MSSYSTVESSSSVGGSPWRSLWVVSAPLKNSVAHESGAPHFLQVLGSWLLFPNILLERWHWNSVFLVLVPPTFTISSQIHSWLCTKGKFTGDWSPSTIECPREPLRVLPSMLLCRMAGYQRPLTAVPSVCDFQIVELIPQASISTSINAGGREVSILTLKLLIGNWEIYFQ